MIIALPMNSQDIDDFLSKSFAKSNYFLLYNSRKNSHLFIKNDGNEAKEHIGIKAADVIFTAQIKVYKNIEKSALENVKAYKNNQLKALEKIQSENMERY